VTNAFISMRKQGVPKNITLSGRTDLIVSSESRRLRPQQPALGWEDHCLDLHTHEIDGEHQKLVLPPLVDALGKLIQGLLDR